MTKCSMFLHVAPATSYTHLFLDLIRKTRWYQRQHLAPSVVTKPLTGVRAHGGIAQSRWRGLCSVH